MRFAATFLALAATVGLVAAQQKCDAQNIVDACVSSYKSRIDACNAKGQDYICLCDVYTDVLVCYNNCPNSNEKPPAEGTKTSYCNAALPLRPAASASAASVASEAATRSQYVASATKSVAAGVSATGTGVTEAKPTVSSFQGAAGGVKGWSAGVAGLALFAGLL